MKKVNKNLILAVALCLILLNPKLSHSEELDEDDLKYQMKVMPMIVAATNHFNEVSENIRTLNEYPSLDLAFELCRDSNSSYKTISTLGKSIASVKPGRVYLKYSQLLSQLFELRKAMVLLLVQSCASHPIFKNPEVWNSFRVKSIQLEEQIAHVSARIQEELINIDKSFQDER